jgi:hypothetical protein
MNLKKTEDKEISQFSLEYFTLYELSKDGLISKMSGDDGIRYTNRYVVSKMDYTDNSKELISNMTAKSGIYKQNIVYLSGDVAFKRDDGLRFFSQKVVYNKTKDIVSSDVDYIAYMGENYLFGKSVVFDNKKSTMKSKNINAVYNLEQKKN